MKELQKTNETKNKTGKIVRWDTLSTLFGMSGFVFAFLPYLSLLGVLLGVLAIGLSIQAIKASQKSLRTWLGLITGSITLFALIIVIGLISFF